MFTRIIKNASLITTALIIGLAAAPPSHAGRDFVSGGGITKAKQVGGMESMSGVVRVKSAYSMQETIERLQKDIADKKIMIFSVVDQARLAADAGINLGPSTLLIFGNPPLGTQFLTSNPVAGIDWPVRLLVFEDNNHDVWLAYTDFSYIARRHGITDRDPAFKMASNVITSITSSVQSR